MKESGIINNSYKKSYFIIEKAKLLPGDVILAVGHGSLGRAVRVADGRFSHAMLYVGGGMVAEAVGNGTALIGIELVLVRQPQDLAVFRMPAGTLSEIQQKQIENSARARMFSPYSMRGAVLTKLGGSRNQQGRFFCSQLVALAYAEAGIELVKEMSPDQVTPNVLAGPDSQLQCVFDPAPCTEIVPQSSEDANHYEALLDRHAAMKKRMPGRNLEIDQKAHAKFRPLIDDAIKKDRFVVNLPKADNMSYLVSVLGSAELSDGDGISDELVKFLDENHYFDLGLQLHKEIIEECRDDYASGKHDRILSAYAGIPDKQNAARHWREQEQACLNMPFPRSIHRRLAEMLGMMASLADAYCEELKEMYARLQGQSPLS